MELLLIEVGSTLLLITATMWALSGAPVCVLAGLIVETVRGAVTALAPVKKVVDEPEPGLPAISVYVEPVKLTL